MKPERGASLNMLLIARSMKGKGVTATELKKSSFLYNVVSIFIDYRCQNASRSVSLLTLIMSKHLGFSITLARLEIISGYMLWSAKNTGDQYTYETVRAVYKISFTTKFLLKSYIILPGRGDHSCTTCKAIVVYSEIIRKVRGGRFPATSVYPPSST